MGLIWELKGENFIEKREDLWICEKKLEGFIWKI
jgi:hypothetical protein